VYQRFVTKGFAVSTAEIAKQFDISHMDSGFADNPYPVYRALRDHDPVHRNADGSYFLTRFEDVRRGLRDACFSSDKRADFKPKFGDGTPLYVHHTTSIVFSDDPMHARIRKLLAAAFSPRKVAALEPIIERFIEQSLDRLEDMGEFDVIKDYALGLPTEIIANMLGIPADRRHKLHDYSNLILGALDPVVSPENLSAGHKAVEEFGSELAELAARRRREPKTGSDAEVLTALIFGEVDGEKLSDLELIHNCIFLLNAGHETTANTVGNGLDSLLDYPDQLLLLRDDPGLIGTAIEEFLRFQSPLQIGNRKVLETVEFAGVEIQKGAFLYLCIAGANRDPDVFSDPERLDITRNPNPHLAFGTGKHICMGNTLGRIEGQTAIGKLVQRFPKLQRNGDKKWHGRSRFRGLSAFPVRVR
jgi:cytochrome P450